METFIDLYKFLQKQDTIKNFFKLNWISKEKQESIFRLFSFLHLIKPFDGYHITKGNFNKATLSPTSLSECLNRKIKEKGDKSDLSLFNDDNLIITTSKNLKSYHIQDLEIRELMNLSKKYNKNIILCIIIRNKKQFYDIVNHAEACNDDIKQYIYNPTTIVLDQDDLINIFYHFKVNYSNITIKQLLEKDKKPYILKFHQELTVNKTLDLIKNEKTILWGHLPRSGKSYCMLGLINKYKCDNTLIITTAPNETIKQYLELFNSCIQFNDYTVLHCKSKTKPKLTKKNIIICSKQFLQLKQKENTIQWLKDIKFNLRFIDESHNGGTTLLAKTILNNYGRNSIYSLYNGNILKTSSNF
jgi:hypothetical protein